MANLFDIFFGDRDRPVRRDLRVRITSDLDGRPADESIQNLISERIQSLRTNELFGRLPPFQEPRLRRGNLRLGQDLDGDPIQIWTRWLGALLGTFANTGGGKSNLMILILLQLAASGSQVWIAEMYRTEMRHLRPIFRRLGLDLIILRPPNGEIAL